MSEYKIEKNNNKIAVDRSDIKAFAGIAAVYLLIEAAGITCPIKFLTGISCAGCGMSRAWIAVMHLEFGKAFYYHPLFWILIPAGILIFTGHKLPKKVYHAIFYGICILMLGVYLIRFFDHSQDIVVFDPMNGLFMRILRYIGSVFGLV